MLCSVVTESRRKQLEYERSIGVNTRRSPKELSQGFVIYLFHDKESLKFPTHCFLIFKTNYWQMTDSFSSVFYNLTALIKYSFSTNQRARYSWTKF